MVNGPLYPIGHQFNPSAQAIRTLPPTMGHVGAPPVTNTWWNQNLS